MNQTSIQDQLFTHIKEQISPEEGIVDVISELLHLSPDSTYRRIRGETPLVMDEIVKICSHFRLSMDRLFGGKNNTVLFEDTRVHHEKFTYANYLAGLKMQVDSLEKFEKKEVIYMSKDLPLFYNFYFKPLIAFRYFFWMKIQLLDPEFEQVQFDIDLIPPSIETASFDLVKTYSKIPTTEIWNMESINSTISQIEFSRTSGHFKNTEDVMLVYDALESSILHIREQVEHGSKFMPGEDPFVQPQNLKFFFNRVVLGDNTIMTIANDIKTAFINYGHLNYLMTRDDSFCTTLYHDFENIKRRSTLISVSSERQRNIFFNILLSKIRERKLNAG